LLFEECLPGKREGSLNQFDSALTFVNKVRNRYQNDPNTYNTFLGLLRDYQRGGRAQEDVSLAVTWLLREHPDLVLEFSKFCNAGQVLKNSDSNETLGPIEENTPLLDERVDLESQAPKRRYKNVYITFGLICFILAALALLYHFGFLQEFIKLIGQ
jgi:histone deacetylase complex regulatory component SIN3